MEERITKEQLVRAFAERERRNRDGKTVFLTDNETAALSLQDYGQQSADYIFELVREQSQ